MINKGKYLSYDFHFCQVETHVGTLLPTFDIFQNQRVKILRKCSIMYTDMVATIIANLLGKGSFELFSISYSSNF